MYLYLSLFPFSKHHTLRPHELRVVILSRMAADWIILREYSLNSIQKDTSIQVYGVITKDHHTGKVFINECDSNNLWDRTLHAHLSRVQASLLSSSCFQNPWLKIFLPSRSPSTRLSLGLKSWYFQKWHRHHICKLSRFYYLTQWVLWSLTTKVAAKIGCRPPTFAYKISFTIFSTSYFYYVLIWSILGEDPHVSHNASSDWPSPTSTDVISKFLFPLLF